MQQHADHQAASHGRTQSYDGSMEPTVANGKPCRYAPQPEGGYDGNRLKHHQAQFTDLPLALWVSGAYFSINACVSLDQGEGKHVSSQARHLAVTPWISARVRASYRPSGQGSFRWAT
jgi:hypothetical protein